MADAPPHPQVFRRRIFKAGAFQFLPIELFFLSEKLRKTVFATSVQKGAAKARTD
nr:MAG TPA: hypothetical protein [Caudoviricetes sp.]